MMALVPKVAWAKWLCRTYRLRILERTNEGRLEAKANGIKFGRKQTVDRQKVLMPREQGLVATKIAKQLKIGHSTVYQVLTSVQKCRKIVLTNP